MYNIVGYGNMLADAGRTSAYARALAARITPGSVVLDIGTGPGIMALLACRAGAARVYAVESDDVIQLAREVTAANGYGDRVRFVQGLSTEVTLPERVDGIVADVRGVLPLYETCVVSMIDARKRFLKPGGWIVPARETIWAALASSIPARNVILDAWNNEYGLDFSIARTRAANHWRKMRLTATDLLVPPQCWAPLEYESLESPNVDKALVWIMGKPAVGHGIALWFDAETAPGVRFSNSPLAGEDHVYGQLFFPWPEPITLAEGAEVRVRLRADFIGSDYVWAWDTSVADRVSGAVIANYRQSSFLGAALSPERLRKHADTFVPDLGDDGRIDREILNLMDRKLSLDEIATKLMAAFPSHFKEWRAAFDRVGGVSTRYSR